MVTANEAPTLFVCRIKNELLELPISKVAITDRYFQYSTGNSRNLTSIVDFAATGTGRSRTNSTIRNASRPGTIATKNIHRILKWKKSTSRTANNGSKQAPRLSPIPSRPKPRPLFSSDTEEAIRASRGAERKPAPKRSRKRPPKTPGHAVAIPIRGLPRADTKYPASARVFLLWSLSESQPEKP